MKIAICSLSSFSYIANFAEVAQGLSKTHEVCYFLGFQSQPSIYFLCQKQITYKVLLDPYWKIDSVLISPTSASSTHALFQQYFIKYSQLILPYLLRELESWQPDLVGSFLRDYAGITAAEILNIPCFSFGPYCSPSRVETIDPPFGTAIDRDAPDRFKRLMWRQHYAFEEKITPFYNQHIRQPYGLSDVRGISTLHSNRLTLLEMIPSLSNKYSPEPSYIKYTGLWRSNQQPITPEAEAHLIDRIQAMPHPRVFLSLGITYAERLLEPCLQALAEFPGTVIVSLSGKTYLPLRALLELPHIVWYSFFENMDAIIRISDAVVSVGAGKTVLRCLAQGKPLICVPQQGEQWEIALALRSVGAAEIPCPRKWDAKTFVEIAKQVATEERYAQVAKRLQAEIQQCGGVEAAVKAIEALSPIT